MNLYRLDHFYSLDFDLAIFGQGVWLLSRGDVPFVTIRGLNLFGEHATWIHLPVALLFAVLGPLADVRVLVLLQSGALALAGLFLYRIAGREVGASAGILVLLSYLLHPALQHTWLEYYEPVSLAVPCLVAATQAVREGRDRPALLWSLIALSTIENVAATVLALGGYALAAGRRRLGLGLVGVASVHLLVIMRVTFPWLSEHGYVFADRLYGDFAESLPQAVAYLARPDHFLGRLATPANGRYLLGLLVPVAFLPLAAPARRRRGAAGALAIGIGAGQVLYGSAWIVPREGPRFWRGLAEDAEERAFVQALLARLPPEASVSAHYRFLPALCRRSRLFMFPDTGPEGTWPDALVVDEAGLDAASKDAVTLRRARAEAGYREVARTARGTVLLFRGDGEGPPAEPGALRRSPPIARPGGLDAPMPRK